MPAPRFLPPPVPRNWVQDDPPDLERVLAAVVTLLADLSRHMPGDQLTPDERLRVGAVLAAVRRYRRSIAPPAPAP